jgi:hypothetical protein
MHNPAQTKGLALLYNYKECTIIEKISNSPSSTNRGTICGFEMKTFKNIPSYVSPGSLLAL